MLVYMMLVYMIHMMLVYMMLVILDAGVTVQDLHVDQGGNLEVLRDVSGTAFLDDVLLIAGDIADSLTAAKQALEILRPRFHRVVAVPGNHDCWLRPQVDGGQHPDSLAKLLAFWAMCDALDVDVATAQVHPDLVVVPLLSWYHHSWDIDDPRPGRLRFDSFCRWPVDEVQGLWQLMLALNRPALAAAMRLRRKPHAHHHSLDPLTAAAAVGEGRRKYGQTQVQQQVDGGCGCCAGKEVCGGCTHTGTGPSVSSSSSSSRSSRSSGSGGGGDGSTGAGSCGASWHSVPAADPTPVETSCLRSSLATSLTRLSLSASDLSSHAGGSWQEAGAGRRECDVITMSHFLPRTELPCNTGMPELRKAMGCLQLEQQVDSVAACVHVYGHSHVPLDTSLPVSTPCPPPHPTHPSKPRSCFTPSSHPTPAGTQHHLPSTSATAAGATAGAAVAAPPLPAAAAAAAAGGVGKVPGTGQPMGSGGRGLVRRYVHNPLEGQVMPYFLCMWDAQLGAAARYQVDLDGGVL
ncbi:hypothetical protein QJQ45_006958 [Haematococcus lacustris]|nr:hypothetical protein QJQ45_006958 [Haematococcus lacustris]